MMKISFLFTFVLLSSTDVLGYRIKRKNVKAHKVGVRTSQELTANRSSQYAKVDDTEEDELVLNASSVQRVVDHSSDMQVVLEYAVWILGKASSAYSVYSTWGDVKLALDETRLAAEEAEAAFFTLGDKVSVSMGKFASSGLDNFADKVQKGSVDHEAMKTMLQKKPSGEDSDFVSGLSLFRSSTAELDLISITADKIIQVVEGVKELMGGVTELTDAYVKMDMSIFDSLKKQVEKGRKVIHDLMLKVEEQYQEVQRIVSEFLKSAWDKAVNLADRTFQSVFGDLYAETGAFKTVFDLVVKPMIEQIVTAVRALADIAQDYMLPGDAPKHVADLEAGYYTQCSWRNSRWVDDIKNVDIENTMTCEMMFFGKYQCSCIATDDCYVTKSYRQSLGGDASKKQCYKAL